MRGPRPPNQQQPIEVSQLELQSGRQPSTFWEGGDQLRGRSSVAYLGLVYFQGSDGVEPKETAPLEGDQQQGDERVPPPRFRPRYRR